MDTGTIKKIVAIIIAVLCSWVIADYLSTIATRMLGFRGPEMYIVSFILYAVIFLIVLSGLQRASGVFVFDVERLE